jgi:hypothetical protein
MNGVLMAAYAFFLFLADPVHGFDGFTGFALW